MSQSTCLMKLAVCENEKHKSVIKECCSHFGAHFIPIFDNRFAILTDKREISYGAEDGSYSHSYNVKTFVDVYNCAKNHHKKNKSFFGVNKPIYYSGELLDNLFFKNVIKFCEDNNIEILCAKYVSNLSSDNSTDDLAILKDHIDKPDKYKILKLIIDLEGAEIIFDKIGYVDIEMDYLSYQQKEKLILAIIIAGLKD